MSDVLPDIDVVEPLSASDELCLQEVRNVLARHGNLNRFGLNLLHTHFPVADNEMLVEECDPETRTLTIRPRRVDELADTRSIETNWILTNGAPVMKCVVVCAMSDRGGHNKVHANTPDPKPGD